MIVPSRKESKFVYATRSSYELRIEGFIDGVVLHYIVSNLCIRKVGEYQLGRI